MPDIEQIIKKQLKVNKETKIKVGYCKTILPTIMGNLVSNNREVPVSLHSNMVTLGKPQL